ncbi:MAG: hypothetical protein PHP85_05290 [Gallionella sp.]|nr:hypothetical protein [Gallionella sp.]
MNLLAATLHHDGLLFYSQCVSAPGSLSDLFRECDGDDGGARGGDAPFGWPKQANRLPVGRQATPQYVKITPSLRVASKNSVCGVANLDNGVTIVKIRALQPSFFCEQRILRNKSDRLPGWKLFQNIKQGLWLNGMKWS